MKTMTFIKRFCTIIIALLYQVILYAQTQYDYYDDRAVAEGADIALNGILLFVGLIISHSLQVVNNYYFKNY